MKKPTPICPCGGTMTIVTDKVTSPLAQSYTATFAACNRCEHIEVRAS